MAYDAARGETVLFGGYRSLNWLNDTWVWNGSTWTQRQNTSPPPGRREHVMTYHPGLRLVLLFGGEDANGYLQDTWAWNGTNWGPLPTQTTPPPMTQGYGLAYDTNRGSVVMYGSIGFAQYQTWEFANGNWSRLQTATTPGCCIRGMATHPANGRPVVQISPGGAVDDWELVTTNGTPNWVRINTSSPRLRYLVTGPNGKLIGLLDDLFAGREVYELPRPGSWSLRTSPTLPPEIGPVTYDSTRRVVVMHYSVFSRLETWEFDNEARQALHVASGAGCGAPPLAISGSAGSRPVMGTNFTVDVANMPSPAAVMSIGLSSTRFGGFSLPLPLAFYGMPGCSLYHDQLVPSLPIVATTPGNGRFSIPIPSVRSLLGVSFFLQSLKLAPGANPAGVITSNLVSCTIGNY